MKGEWFEVKTSALLYLRGINSKQDFQLASNVEQARNFDDIVLKYKTPDDDSWHSCFIQLKHKERAALSSHMLTSADKGGFSLKKYLKSFSDIKRKMLLKTDDLLFNGPFDQCDFVIYTNALLERGLAERQRDDIRGPVSDLLMSAMEHERIVRFDEDTDQDIYSAMASSGPDAREFLHKLTVYSGQPSESQMNELIKEELKITCGEHKSDVDIIYSFLIDAVQQWWSEEEVVFLNQDSSLLNDSIDQYRAFALTSNQKQIYRLKIKFQEVCLKRLRDEVCKIGPLFCVETTPLTVKLSCTKVLQILREEKDAYIFVGLECLLCEHPAVVSGWMSGPKRYLVIVSQSNSEHLDLCVKLCAALSSRRSKRVVLLHCCGDLFSESLRRNLNATYEVFQDSFEVSQLDKASNEKIVKKEVVFQGSTIYLKQLFKDCIAQAQTLIAHNLSTIVNSDSLFIGNEFPDIADELSLHTLLRTDILKSELLTIDLPCVIAVSDVTDEELQILSRSSSETMGNERDKQPHFRVLDNQRAEEDFQQLCEVHNNIHWVSMKSRVRWIRTKGNLKTIREFVDETRWSAYNAVTAMDLEDRVVLLAVGVKTRNLMSDIARQTKKLYPATWVLQLRLVDHAQLLDSCRCDEVRALNFLMEACEFDEKTSFERDLFRFSVEKSGNVVVFLDGFDDGIPSIYVQKVCALLTNLLSTKVWKVWVSCGLENKEMLENVLSTFAFVIKK